MPLIGRLRDFPSNPTGNHDSKAKDNRHDVALAGWKERQISGFLTIARAAM
jgi:hypothetical protein